MPSVLVRLDLVPLAAALVLVSCAATSEPRPAEKTPTPDDAPARAEATPTPPTPTAAAGPSRVGAPAVPTTPELSTTDLLTVEGFVGTDASVLGLRLGQTWDEAKAIVDAHPDLVFDLDEANPGRFYVQDAGGGPGDLALFYCQWPDGRKTMGRLVIYPRAKRLMPEGAARLLGLPSLADASPAVAAWLGKPDRSVVSLDIPSIGLKLTTHVFEPRAIEVTDYASSGDAPNVILALVVPELLERAVE
jgi:hypothetical protein